MNTISVVTPTLHRPTEVGQLLENLNEQTVLPTEVIVIDGAEPDDCRTEHMVKQAAPACSFETRYLRSSPGTAVQRNVGIEAAGGSFIAFIDDDVRLDPHFFETMVDLLAADPTIGAAVGYRRNIAITPDTAVRWRWYRRLRLLSTFEPGRYDRRCGYPINNNLQPRFSGTRPVDFMTTACAVWRRSVFDDGLRFDPWFADYGVLEDAHLSLRAGKRWRLVQAGDATCIELHAAGGRPNGYRTGYKAVVNYLKVFTDIEGPLTSGQRFRFWRFQAFELARMAVSVVRRRRRVDVDEVRGRLAGMRAVRRGALHSAP